MIYAKNADALAYRGIHPNLDLALEHITPEFLASLRDKAVRFTQSVDKGQMMDVVLEMLR